MLKKLTLKVLLLIPSIVMAQSGHQATTELLQAYADAFNAHDIPSILSLMTDDCIFEASSGPDADGQKFEGREQVKKAFEQVFENFPDARWNDPRHLIAGDRGISEWTFTGTGRDGRRVEVTGCDLFTFMNGKIAVKNSYRKNRIQSR